MISFLDLSGVCQSLVLVLFNAILLCNIYCVVSCIILKTKALNSVLNLTLLLVSFMSSMLLFGCYKEISETKVPEDFVVKVLSVPVSVTVAFAALLIVASCIAVIRIKEWRQTNVTQMSVVEGTDKLPIGLCYYTENGIPKLRNQRMNYLCRSIIGEPLFDAREFWNRLLNGDVLDKNSVIMNGDTPIVSLAEGTVYLFSRKEIYVNREKAYEITATDITEKYALGQQLSEYNEGLRKVNKHLEYYSETVADITREREILAAKISIHDKLGKAQIATRRYIESGGSAIDRETLLEIWRNNIALLNNETATDSEDSSLDELLKAAEVLGIKLSVIGTLPNTDNRVMRLIMSGARECLTNAVKHAKAKEMHLEIADNADSYIVEYTNDGSPPCGKISEGGGLTYLRRIVENSGGKMEIFSEPQFVLKLTIPKKGELYSW